MPSTTTEATRDELIAEFVARDALMLVQNRLYGVLWGEDKDVLAKMPDDTSDALVEDYRFGALFSELWPEDEDTESDEYNRAAAESAYLAARILRAAVYHADHLREEAQGLFRIADKWDSKVAQEKFLREREAATDA